MRKQILILSNHFITIYNFRKELIKTLIDDGNKVFISTPKNKENLYFEKMGCTILETPVDRRGINPLTDLKLIKNYINIIKAVNPDIIFSYTIKPNIYGCIASNILNYKQVSNITGTGATFIKKDLISFVAKFLYKISLKNSYKVFFQNSGDKDFFVKNKMVKNNYDLLAGSGVNLEQFEFHNMPDDDFINFIFIGRVMKVKGIDEYLKTAKTVKSKYKSTNFYICGFIEEDTYNSIIDDYHKKGIVNYLGFQKDIKAWIKKCHCTVLPSHGGEGVPNVLLESSAMGRACIASDINGSNDVIEHGVNGYLFNVQDSGSLSESVIKFINLNHEEKKQMGLSARNKVEQKFDRTLVINKYLKEVKNA